MFAAIAGGGPPASTRSKCSRERSSSPSRKKARASSRRTRTRPGRSTRTARSAATASSSRAARSPSPAPACCEAPMAARPTRNRTSVRSAWSGASGRRIASASGNRLLSISARASLTRGSEDRWGRSEADKAEAGSRTATAKMQTHFIVGTEKRKGGRAAALPPFRTGTVGPRVTAAPAPASLRRMRRRRIRRRRRSPRRTYRRRNRDGRSRRPRYRRTGRPTCR